MKNYSNVLGAAPLPYPLPAADGGGFVTLTVNFHYRFVKINNNLSLSPENAVVAQVLGTFPLTAFKVRDDTSTTLSPVGTVTAQTSTIKLVAHACTPKNSTVYLPSIYESDVLAVPADSAVPGTEKEFHLEISCPTCIGYIGDYVMDTNGFENQAQGVIKLGNSSTAKGIGLRITTRSQAQPFHIHDGINPNSGYQPVKFGPGNRYRIPGSTRYARTLDNHNPITHTTDHPVSGRDIPLKVAVWRTAVTPADVEPGSDNGSIIFHLIYR